MDNGYQILDQYRIARGLSWEGLRDEMGLRGFLSFSALQKLVQQPDRKPRPAGKRKIGAWVNRNRVRMNAVIRQRGAK